jgi:hypothetical protein
MKRRKITALLLVIVMVAVMIPAWVVNASPVTNTITGATAAANGVTATVAFTDGNVSGNSLTVTFEGEATAAGTHTVGITGTGITVESQTRTSTAGAVLGGSMTFTFTQPTAEECDQCKEGADSAECAATHVAVAVANIAVTHTFAAPPPPPDDRIGTITFNPAAETVTISGSGLVFYAVRFQAGRASSARWIPVFDRTIDVSRLIPRRAGQPFVIAFTATLPVPAEHTWNESNMITLPPRADAPARTAVTFSNGALTLAAGVARDSLQFKVNDSAWTTMTDEQFALFANPDNFPFGAIVSVRTAATSTAATSQRFIRVRIPAQPKAPRLDNTLVRVARVDGADVMGLRTRAGTEIRGRVGAGEWTSWADAPANMTAAQIRAHFNNATTVPTEAGSAAIEVQLEIRSKATDRRPFSMVAPLTVTLPAIPAAATS